MSGSGPLNPPRTFNTTSVDVLGTDLGIPIEHAGRLYFFGDCREGGGQRRRWGSHRLDGGGESRNPQVSRCTGCSTTTASSIGSV
ncbi:MAG: hypothetical protein R2712_27265 [Vicinamibacterales bacterium]